MRSQSKYGHNIIVHGISNGRSGVGLFVTRLAPILLIKGDLVVNDVFPSELRKDNHLFNQSVNRPYGKNYRKSFLGKSN